MLLSTKPVSRIITTRLQEKRTTGRRLHVIIDAVITLIIRKILAIV